MQAAIRQGFSAATDARQAVRELRQAIDLPELSLLLFFSSADYDLTLLSAELNHVFSGIQVVGCTTAGEIGPAGYRERGLVGVGFAPSAFDAVSGYCTHLGNFEPSYAHTLADRLLFELQQAHPAAAPENTFAFLMVDGLSCREEIVARTVKEALGSIALSGGSAGNGLCCGPTWVFANGSFRPDSAALVLISTPLPFTVFKTEHLVPTDERWVITAADPARRIVREINGRPAAEEFARINGISADELTASHFAATPLAITIGSSCYLRSVRAINDDRSVTFYCALDEGVVLRIARSGQLIENLQETFARIRSTLGAPLLVLACECFLRRIEILERHLENEVDRIFLRNAAAGFITYGEIFQGIHLNQTLCGIALGSGASEFRND